MFKDATPLERYPWIKGHTDALIRDIRKDLKQDHLKKDTAFLKKYFPGKVPNKLTQEELAAVYGAVLAEGDEALWDFAAERWLLKHTDIYNLFEHELKKVSEDFSSLTELDKAAAEKLMEESVARFGAVNTLLFAVLNSVVFPKSVYEKLSALAEVKEEVEESDSSDSLERKYEQQIKRLEERYEKKLAGMERKYLADTAALKKQISTLQRKLSHEPTSV
ncbi:MAG: hypothetical protein KDK48_03255 [Chlamydiia bacterium]|nr:hypothetical protein [Chlamydiia bacterium]